ncbi:MAG TPA: serine/threonine-protein kinase [Actinomycetota bacterium]|jgi:serine/threonine-protein kinase
MSSDLRPGSQIAEYRVERLVGRGGMGVVYLAEHVHLGKRVALKVLPPEYMEDTGFRKRFEREARLAASLEHPNIVPVTDAGEFEGELWIAMRFVDGTDLREVLQEHHALNPIRAVSILGRVGSALDAAHKAGLIHRDVKPGNILLEPPSATRQVEHVYLTDFGLTKQVDAGSADVTDQFASDDQAHDAGALRAPGDALTRVGYFAGTVDYAAPEQFRGEPLDGRVDVYALGCVLYECLTGSVPFAADDEHQVMLMHIEAPVPKASTVRPGMPRGLDAVIARAMAKDRDARFPTCRELIDAARSFLSGWDPSRLGAPADVAPAPAPPPGSLAGAPGSDPSVSWGSFPSGASFAGSTSSVPATPSEPSVPSQASVPSVPGPSVPPVPVQPSTSGSVSGVPSVPGTPPAPQPSSPSAPRSFPPPAAPSTTSYRTGRRRIGSGNPLLTWVLAGVGAAIVVVLLLILFAK